MNKEVEALQEAASRARRDGHSAVAYGALQRCEKLCHASGDKDGLAWTLLKLAENTRDYTPAEVDDTLAYRKRLLQDALDLFRTFHNDLGGAKALRLLSALVPSAEANVLLERSLAISRAIGDVGGALLAQMQIGTKMYLEGKKAESLRLIADIVEESRAWGDDEITAHAIVALALASGDDTQATGALFDQAQGLFARLGDRMWQVICFFLCAEFGCEANDGAAKMRYLQRALELSRQTGSTMLESGCLRQLARFQRDERSSQHVQGSTSWGSPESGPDERVLELEAAQNRGDYDAQRVALIKLMEGRKGNEETQR